MAKNTRLVARNHRKEFRSGQTLPQVFECTDEAEWVLKLMGNSLGYASLATDWVGGTPATMLGVPTPELCIVDVDRNALRTAPDSVQEWAEPGPALGSRYIVQNDSPLRLGQVTQCWNLDDIAAIVVLDTWIEVLDRRRPDGKWNLLIDKSDVNPRLVVIDYGFSLSETLQPRSGVLVGAPTQKLLCPEGLEPYLDWEVARAAIARLLDISREEIAMVVESIPVEWEIDNARRLATIEYLFERRDLVRQLVEQEVLA